MSLPTKRARGDGDAADEPAEGGAVVASTGGGAVVASGGGGAVVAPTGGGAVLAAGASGATSSQQGVLLVNGLAVKYSFVYTTMFYPAAVMYLHTNGQVAFQQGADMAPCCSHGSWALSHDQLTLRVHFHFKGNWGRLREHVYLRLPHSSSFELQVNNSEYRAFLIQRTFV
jgi:hypothetical protein